MTNQEEELISSYKEHFNKETGGNILIYIERKEKGDQDFDCIKNLVEDYMKTFDIDYKTKKSSKGGKTIGATAIKVAYMHILRYTLYFQYDLLQKQVGFYTNADRTSIYNSVNRVEQYIKVMDQKFIEAIDDVIAKGFNMDFLKKKIKEEWTT